jgi:hypothetical protein
MATQRFVMALVGAVSLVVAVACGGGGGGGSNSPAVIAAPPDSIDKYVGNWVDACEPLTTATFAIDSVVIAKKTNASAVLLTTSREFNNATCQGTPTALDSLTSTLTINGTKTVTGLSPGTTVVADKVLFGTVTAVIYIDNNQQYFGNPTASVDPEGYPNTLYTSSEFTKVP